MTHRSPADYDGRPLCPCCGEDENGDDWGSCVAGYTHEETCARHVYADDLCAKCARTESDGSDPAQTNRSEGDER